MTTKKRILAVEPYYGGSHKAWIDGWIKRSRHEITLLTLPARKWKWRMRGAAVELAERFNQEFSTQTWDGLIASDMMNLAEFIALTRPAFERVPSILYLHENQYSYPLHPEERIDFHFVLTNFVSMEAATQVVFNSEFNRDDFFRGIQHVFKKMPDFTPDAAKLERMKQESLVIPPCVELPEYKPKMKPSGHPPVILWNHRWDRDKQPDFFMHALTDLTKQGVDFQTIICGECFENGDEWFKEAPERLGERLLHLGYAESRQQYEQFLHQSDIVISTAMQEFFGISIVEAVAAGAFPVLPNRLNYPYLIPDAFHKSVLYDDANLTGHLKRTVGKWKNGDLPNLSEYMKQYEWDYHVDTYDGLFGL